jgi:hypothetical protein
MVRTRLFVVGACLVVAWPAFAQITFVVPAWQPIAPPIVHLRAVPAIPLQPRPTTIERYYFLPGETNVDTRPPAHSTDAPPIAAPLTDADIQPKHRLRAVIIREYFIPEQPVDPAINQIPIPTTIPRRLVLPPWSDDYENPEPRAEESRI